MIDILTDAGIRQALTAFKETSVQHVYEPLQPEQLEIMNNLFPDMQAIHKANKTISGNLSDSHPVYPGQMAMLGPYYMNGYDPDSLGKWQLRVSPERDKSSLKAIIDSQPGEVTGFSIGVVTEKGYSPATQEDYANIFSVLALMVGSAERYEPSPKTSVFSRLGALMRPLMSKH